MSQELTEKPPTVSKVVLMVVVWIGVFLATSAVALRGYIRLRYNGRFQLDDIFAAVALALLFASGVLYSIAMDPLFQLANVAAGIEPEPEGEAFQDFETGVNLYLRLQFAITLAFWSCLWVVKASFLTFFYPLSNGLRVDRILWYCVTAFASAGYIACVVSYPVSCSQFTLGRQSDTCDFPGTCGADRNIQLSIVSLKMSTALDIASDLFIIALPWKLLWVVKRSRKEKLAIGSIVGLGILIILFAIIRIIVTNTTHTHPEPVWLALWSSIETSVAVVVISLTSLKVFFTKSGNSSNAQSGYLHKPGQNFGERYKGRSAAASGPIPGAPIELGESGSRGQFRSVNGEVRKGSTSNESEEILVHNDVKQWPITTS